MPYLSTFSLDTALPAWPNHASSNAEDLWVAIMLSSDAEKRNCVKSAGGSVTPLVICQN